MKFIYLRTFWFINSSSPSEWAFQIFLNTKNATLRFPPASSPTHYRSWNEYIFSTKQAAEVVFGMPPQLGFLSLEKASNCEALRITEMIYNQKLRQGISSDCADELCGCFIRLYLLAKEASLLFRFLPAGRFKLLLRLCLLNSDATFMLFLLFYLHNFSVSGFLRLFYYVLIML